MTREDWMMLPFTLMAWPFSLLASASVGVSKTILALGMWIHDLTDEEPKIEQ